MKTPVQPALALLEGVVRAVDGDDVVLVIAVARVVGEAVAAHVDAAVVGLVAVERPRDVVSVPAALKTLKQ